MWQVSGEEKQLTKIQTPLDLTAKTQFLVEAALKIKADLMCVQSHKHPRSINSTEHFESVLELLRQAFPQSDVI